MELGGGGWSWVELGGGGWSWVKMTIIRKRRRRKRNIFVIFAIVFCAGPDIYCCLDYVL